MFQIGAPVNLPAAARFSPRRASLLFARCFRGGAPALASGLFGGGQPRKRQLRGRNPCDSFIPEIETAF
jgi:hypothetical protein